MEGKIFLKLKLGSREYNDGCQGTRRREKWRDVDQGVKSFGCTG